MSNIFSGLLSSEFKSTHKNMIDSMLDDDSCTVKCRLNYSSTKFEDCINCVFDVIGGKSSNRYQSGGPIPFSQGICPMCNGVGKRQVNTTDIIYLAPVWDSKDWLKLSQSQINTADISVQTMSKISTYPKLVRATSVVIDVAIENYGIPPFTRVGRPEVCGLGGSDFIITSWTRQ